MSFTYNTLQKVSIGKFLLWNIKTRRLFVVVPEVGFNISSSAEIKTTSWNCSDFILETIVPISYEKLCTSEHEIMGTRDLLVWVCF